MKILAIDPGTTKSAAVIYDSGVIVSPWMADNKELLRDLHTGYAGICDCKKLYIEMVASYGMAVGKSVFETCVWVGRFIEAWGDDWEYVYRKDVKLHLCGQTKANDSNIRQAIMDRYGSERSKAIGVMKSPGPLYGVKKDMWAALGVAITADERNG